jgi:hypothetical protein
MNRFLLFALIFFSQTVYAHEAGIKKYLKGPYESNPFEYPASLADKSINIIVSEIKKVTDYEILLVDIKFEHYYLEHYYEVRTCSKDERRSRKCKDLEIYYFAQGKKDFVNLSITPEQISYIKPDENFKPLYYIKGKYENFPFIYSSDLSKDKIEDIVKKISKITKYEIISVWNTRDSESTYKVRVCSSGSRVIRCDAGKSFIYDTESKKIIGIKGNWVS